MPLRNAGPDAKVEPLDLKRLKRVEVNALHQIAIAERSRRISGR
jgi:hypothetical protein